MSRSLKYDIPGRDWRVDLGALRAKRWRSAFAPELADPDRLVVDVGFGRGEFLLALAAAEPDTAFLGVEYSFKRVLKMARRLALTPLVNVRLVDARAENVVDEALAEGHVETFWMNFPDPWPKKRHHRRRLLQPDFVRSVALRLQPDGVLNVATDHSCYAEAIDATLSAEPLLANVYAPERFRRDVPGRTPTAYQREWAAEGRRLHFFCYRRIARGNGGAGGSAPVACGGALDET